MLIASILVALAAPASAHALSHTPAPARASAGYEAQVAPPGTTPPSATPPTTTPPPTRPPTTRPSTSPPAQPAGRPGAAAPAPQAPSQAQAGLLSVEPPDIHLGRVAPGSRHPVSFTLRNISNGPVTITETKSSCKCTAITSLANTVLAPNETATIQATFDAPSLPGEKDAHIFITVKGLQRPMLATIRAVVRMAVESDPYFVDIRGGKLKPTVRVVARDQKPFRIRSAGGLAPKFIETNASEGDPNAPRTEWYLEADFSIITPENMMQYWVVETDRDDCPIVPVQVRHELTGVRFDEKRGTRFWAFGESLINAGRLEVGKPYHGVVEIAAYNPGVAAPPPRSDWGDVKSLAVSGSMGQVELLGTDTHGDKVVVRFQYTPSAAAAGRCIYEPIELTSASGSGRFFLTASVAEAPSGGGTR